MKNFNTPPIYFGAMDEDGKPIPESFIPNDALLKNITPAQAWNAALIACQEIADYQAFWRDGQDTNSEIDKMFIPLYKKEDLKYAIEFSKAIGNEIYVRYFTKQLEKLEKSDGQL